MAAKRMNHVLSVYPKPSDQETKKFITEQVSQVEQWWGTPRFENIKRPYSALDVVKHRGSLGGSVSYPSSVQAQRLFRLLQEKFSKGEPVHTLGVIDPVQMSQLSRCDDIHVCYISGWACSSTMVGSTNDVSPDFGDYPYDTVPNQVERIFKAQVMHDKKSLLENLNTGAPRIDYLKPIIADADTGHGGTTAVMKLAKLFAEKGAAAIHLEDQLHGGKRCGHLGGAVIVPTSTHTSRLIATRLQWDIMGTENIIIARTDSANGKLLSSTCDPRDHAYIKGIINPKTVCWTEALAELEASGSNNQTISNAEAKWYNENELFTFDEAVERQVNKAEYEEYLEQKGKYMRKLGREYLSLRECREVVKIVAPDKEVYFDWDAPRTKEGYYMLKNCIEAAIQRSLEYAPYADMIWLETKTPDLEQARNFSRKIHRVYPHVKLVYNLSPSFNWSAQGYSKEDLQSFIWDLAREGFVLQLVSLAGLHVDAVSFWQLAQKFQTEGMQAYVSQVQERERDSQCDVLTHQRWSGAEYVDSVMKVVQNGSSSQTLSTAGDSFTETQF